MKKGCARALVSLSDPGALAALQPHLETCAECRAIVPACSFAKARWSPPVAATTLC